MPGLLIAPCSYRVYSELPIRLRLISILSLGMPMSFSRLSHGCGTSPVNDGEFSSSPITPCQGLKRISSSWTSARFPKSCTSSRLFIRRAKDGSPSLASDKNSCHPQRWPMMRKAGGFPLWPANWNGTNLESQGPLRPVAEAPRARRIVLPSSLQVPFS